MNLAAARAKTSFASVGCVLLVVSLASCSKGEQEAAQSASAPARPPVTAATGTAEIAGRIAYEGTIPEARFVHMNADPYCAKANGETKRETVHVGPDRGLGGVFVYVSKGLESQRYAAPSTPVVLDQHACWYSPAIFGVQVGQPLEVRNSDETLHNVHALTETTEGFNIGMPQKGMSAVRTFSKPEALVRIKCDVHPWMVAYVGVVANPFYAVTAEDGSYRLRGLPAGALTVTAVHPELGKHEQQVTLADGAHASANFTFSE